MHTQLHVMSTNNKQVFNLKSKWGSKQRQVFNLNVHAYQIFFIKCNPVPYHVKKIAVAVNELLYFGM